MYSDDEIKQLTKDAIVSALSQRWLAQHTNLEDFYDEAEQLLEDIPTDVLRYFCGETIRSFAYGRQPLDILTQVKDYHSSRRTAKNV